MEQTIISIIILSIIGLVSYFVGLHNGKMYIKNKICKIMNKNNISRTNFPNNKLLHHKWDLFLDQDDFLKTFEKVIDRICTTTRNRKKILKTIISNLDIDDLEEFSEIVSKEWVNICQNKKNRRLERKFFKNNRR